LIGFVFSDWASRTRLPSLLPEPIGGFSLLVKTGLEITGVYFLVASFLLLVGHEGPTPILPTAFSANTCFAFFLVVTWLWDCQMIFIMKQLDLKDLARIVVRGDSFASRGAATYLRPFFAWRTQREARIAEAWETTKAAIVIGPNPTQWSRLLPFIVQLVRSRCPVDAPLKAGLQFLANHILFANLLGGALMMLDEWKFNGASLVNGIRASATIPNLDLGAALGFLPHLAVIVILALATLFYLVLRGRLISTYVGAVGVVSSSVRIPVHREHSFRFNVNGDSGHREHGFRAT
jgi:hypothetical protein